MATAEISATLRADRELQEAIVRAIQGFRDPETMKTAAERMDRMREEMRLRVGEVDFSVSLVRESRDGE